MMKMTIVGSLIVSAAALAVGAVQAQTQQRSTTEGQILPADPARPKNPKANLPSDSGVQVTQPTGAVTGAGQPQGAIPQRDSGSPSGVEIRAREEARAGAKEADEGARGATTTPRGAGGAAGGKSPAK
jgi:hypothetical protein